VRDKLRGGSTQCGQSCVSVQTDGANCGACAAACKAGEVCSAGKCGSACAGGSQACGQSCVDTKNDPANCGSCGNACTGGQVCSAGVCGLSCGGGTTNCGGFCADTKVDPAHCGSCATACGAGEVCSASACKPGCKFGTFSPKVDYATGTAPRTIASGDFNADGKPDIIWSNSITGERALWLMDGTNFLSASTLGVFPLEWTVKN
jgi:hypothetical protein